jgi:hypothetical protein
MNRKASLITFASLLAILLCTATAGAQVLYTSFGPSYAYDNGVDNNWYVGSYPPTGQYFVEAMPFTPNATAQVGSAVLALQNDFGNPAVPGDTAINNTPLIVYLESDNSGQPGAILATLTQGGIIPGYGTGGAPITFTCASCPVVNASTLYWLVAYEPDLFSRQDWMYSYLDSAGSQAFDFNDANSATGPWQVSNQNLQSAFEVDAVPEPGTLLMMGSGAIGLAGLLRRKVMA